MSMIDERRLLKEASLSKKTSVPDSIWSPCTFFIAVFIRLKTYRSNGFFVFTKQNVRTWKIGHVSEVLRAQTRPIGIGRAICPDLKCRFQMSDTKRNYSWKILMKNPVWVRLKSSSKFIWVLEITIKTTIPQKEKLLHIC